MSLHNHPITQEPYLRLPSPHQSIIITPYRAPNPADEAAKVRNMNDPLVAAWLIGPPYPYHADDAKIWTNMSRSQCIQILAEAKTQQYVSGSPFRCVREIVEEDEHGVIQKDVLIGGIDVTEYPFLEFPEGSKEREDGVKRNGELETGSSEKVWGVGGMYFPFLLPVALYSS
ncbi:uncharacterized protein LDX57_010410 [Aspergillus melleus]|uniref:uncharacterized protein n=1 Tax=Aspergillus melleus TaxID=138277 RepID=UPI001E8D5CD8|nr:uncharacterized protein LDX57_010410 [Aspergillus melleus]KAH8432783.1 hypothetical protein LDX57_010410 [Aspergillus melleus]